MAFSIVGLRKGRWWHLELKRTKCKKKKERIFCCRWGLFCEIEKRSRKKKTLWEQHPGREMSLAGSVHCSNCIFSQRIFREKLVSTEHFFPLSFGWEKKWACVLQEFSSLWICRGHGETELWVRTCAHQYGDAFSIKVNKMRRAAWEGEAALPAGIRTLLGMVDDCWVCCRPTASSQSPNILCWLS